MYTLVYTVILAAVVAVDYTLSQHKAHCHCLSGDCIKDIDSSWTCPTYDCDLGWTNSPSCDQECSPLNFGSNCKSTCHCPPGDTCDTITGLCSGDSCAEGYRGPACQTSLPRLTSAPIVTSLNSTEVRVMWKRWMENEDVGDADIHSYTLWYCVSESVDEGCYNGSNMIPTSDIPEPQGDANNLSLVLKDLKANTGYLVTVQTNRLESGKKVGGRNSPLTFFHTGDTDPSNLPAPTDVKARWNDTSLTISWQVPPMLDGMGVKGVVISVSLLQYKACPAPAVEEITSEIRLRNTNLSEYSVVPLVPYTEYRYSLALEYKLFTNTAQSTVKGSRFNQDFSTTHSAPSLPVSGLTITESGSTWLMLTWSAYPCQHWNSHQLIRYDISVALLGETPIIMPVYGGSTVYNFTSLEGGQLYGVRVRPVTNVSVGGWSEDVPAFTNDIGLALIPKLHDVASYNSTCVTVEFTYSPQAISSAPVYEVIYTELSGPQGAIKDGRRTTYRLSDMRGATSETQCHLNAGTEYRVQLIDSTGSVGEGRELEKRVWTKIGVPPSPPTPLVLSITPTTITMRLYPVVSLVGPITSYQIWVSQGQGSGDSLVRRKRDSSALYNISSRLYTTIQSTEFTDVHYELTLGEDKLMPLSSNTQYTIYYVAVSEQEGVTTTNYSHVTLTTNRHTSTTTRDNKPLEGLTDGWIVAIVLLSVALLVAILLILVCCICKQRKEKYYEYDDADDQFDSGTIETQYDDFSYVNTSTDELFLYPLVHVTGYWSPIYSFNESRHLVLEDTELSFEGDHYITFESEFNNLPRGQQYPWTKAAEQTVDLNRVSHLVAYDHNRVVIGQSPLGVDYINATHVKGYNSKCSYIATTSPFNEECALQFWQMVYEQKVTQIVMMTNLVDGGITKCFPYWPRNLETHPTLTFGSITIELREVHVFANFTIYKMVFMSNDDPASSSHVTQYHYTAWPTSGVPETAFPLLEFILLIKTIGCVNSAPMIVHCGTGCSTTGFFIALDYLVDEAVANNNNVSVYNAVSYLRDCRSFMVRTQKQYLLLYDCLSEYVMGGRKYLSFDLKTRYKHLSATNQKTGHTYFHEEVSTLSRYTAGPTEEKLTAAMLEVNSGKNRSSDVLPMDSYRVKLSLEHGTSDYINAVYIDGYHQPKAFILTQTPLQDTVVDFWRMVYEQGISTIVMMDDNLLKDDSCAPYWPETGDSGRMTSHGDELPSASFGEFMIELLNVRQEDGICISRHMVVTNKLQPAEPKRHVKQFQILQWPLRQPKPPKTGLDMLKLANKVKEWQRSVVSSCNQTISSPVLVHCLDGAVHSGVYVATAIICEKMSAQGRVNIFLTVKELKHRRQGIVDSLHQYRYLHRVLWDFINTELRDNELHVEGLSFGHKVASDSTLLEAYSSSDTDND